MSVSYCDSLYLNNSVHCAGNLLTDSHCQMLEYFKWLPRMLHLYSMFSKASRPLWSFIVFLVFVFFATGMFAHFAFGIDRQNFISLWSSYTAQVGMLMGDIDYGDLVDANRGLGLIFFLIFCVLMILILLVRCQVWQFGAHCMMLCRTCLLPLSATLMMKPKGEWSPLHLPMLSETGRCAEKPNRCLHHQSSVQESLSRCL